MDQTPSISPEHRLLVQSLIDGTIDPADVEEMNTLLREDPLLRGFYIDQMRMDSHLRSYHTRKPALVVLGEERKRITRSRILAIASTSAAAGVAAAIALMAHFGAFKEATVVADTTSYSRFTAGPSTVPLARITGLDKVNWSSSTGELTVGTWLPAGKLNIREGLLEITYDSGSSVILKAPATFYIEENNRGFLQSGNIRAHSPKTVAAFEIETPNSKLIDLGTTFGVKTLSASATAVHVFEGLVKARASGDSDTDWKELRAGDSLQIDNGVDSLPEYTSIPSAPSDYDWAPPRTSIRNQPLQYLHWSFDAHESGMFPETGVGFEGENYPAYSESVSGEDPTASLVKEGVFGHALALGESPRFLRTEFSGIAGNAPRTIACWVKVPKRPSSPNRPETIVAWGKPERGKLWKLSLRPRSPNRKLTARTECGYGYTAANSTLSDGKWHHVVSVFTGGPNADSGSSVLHYVDGKLERRVQTVSRRIQTSIDSENSFPLTIGLAVEVPGPKNLENLKQFHENTGKPLRTFTGHIDEVYLFDDALTPSEIIKLMETNTPPE